MPSFFQGAVMKENIEGLSLQKQFELAKQKAGQICTRRRKTKKELEGKLSDLGFDAQVCEAIAEWAQEYYFIDDAAYARDYIESAARKYGKRRIVQALRFKGIAPEVIEDALAEFDFDDVREELCVSVQQRLGGLTDRKSIDKVVRHFLTRGYNYDDVRYAIEQAKLNADTEEDDFGI